MLRLRHSIWLLALNACSIAAPTCKPPTHGELVYIIDKGWHTEIGLPLEELAPHVKFYSDLFPGAKVIMIGYAKKTFVTAPPQTFSEYLFGPIPGAAVIHLMGLSATPYTAYLPDEVTTLTLPKGGASMLADYIWNDLSKDNTGSPLKIGPSSNPAGMYYAAASRYTLLHTCNGWAVGALKATGLPVEPGDVIFSGQVMRRVNKLAQQQCTP